MSDIESLFLPVPWPGTGVWKAIVRPCECQNLFNSSTIQSQSPSPNPLLVERYFTDIRDACAQDVNNGRLSRRRKLIEKRWFYWPPWSEGPSRLYWGWWPWWCWIWCKFYYAHSQFYPLFFCGKMCRCLQKDKALMHTHSQNWLCDTLLRTTKEFRVYFICRYISICQFLKDLVFFFRQSKPYHRWNLEWCPRFLQDRKRRSRYIYRFGMGKIAQMQISKFSQPGHT